MRAIARRPRSVSALLFVYGTLMRGYGLHPVLARGASFVGPGQVRGRLLDLGPYPGLIDGAGDVRGEVYRVDTPELLPRLDEEEGYNFERRRTLVTLGNGRRARAWVYRYTGPRAAAAPISEGDWRRVRPAGPRRSYATPLVTSVARRRNT